MKEGAPSTSPTSSAALTYFVAPDRLMCAGRVIRREKIASDFRTIIEGAFISGEEGALRCPRQSPAVFAERGGVTVARTRL